MAILNRKSLFKNIGQYLKEGVKLQLIFFFQKKKEKKKENRRQLGKMCKKNYVENDGS